jgi:hypothetical protein
MNSRLAMRLLLIGCALICTIILFGDVAGLVSDHPILRGESSPQILQSRIAVIS